MEKQAFRAGGGVQTKVCMYVTCMCGGQGVYKGGEGFASGEVDWTLTVGLGARTRTCIILCRAGAVDQLFGGHQDITAAGCPTDFEPVGG